jgi:hypothetical protein
MPGRAQTRVPTPGVFNSPTANFWCANGATPTHGIHRTPPQPVNPRWETKAGQIGQSRFSVGEPMMQPASHFCLTGRRPPGIPFLPMLTGVARHGTASRARSTAEPSTFFFEPFTVAAWGPSQKRQKAVLGASQTAKPESRSVAAEPGYARHLAGKERGGFDGWRWRPSSSVT